MSALHPAADIRAESGGKKMAESRKKKDVPERSGKSSKTTQKSAAKRKTTNSSAKKSTRQTKQEAAAKAAYGAKMQDEVMVLLSFAVALILILSNFNLVGSVGKGIKWFMFGLFGVVEYIFPVIMAFTLVFMISNKNIIAVARIKTVAVYIFTIILSAVWLRIVNEPKIADAGIMEFFTYSADYKSGGGLFGGILCRILSPMGFWGTMVVLIILAIICIIVITEKSFINGILKVKKNGSRMMMAAKQDYDIYREHSNERLAGRDMYDDEDEETQEEYLARRRREKEAKLQEKYERQEERARKRMNKKARGVTLDTQLPKKEEAVKSVDVHEIVPDISVHDEYSADIYDPGDSFEYMQENVDDKFVVFQSTSIGLAPNNEAVVIDDPHFYDRVSVGIDLIYNPFETKFMKLCRQAGALAYNGLRMLLYQGIIAYELWNDISISEDVADIVYDRLLQSIRENVILIGFMGCGKTTVGEALARKLNFDLLDVDSYIEDKAGCSIKQIFADKGEEYFRQLETDTLKELNSRLSHTVISTGGGLPMRQANVDELRRMGRIIYLDVKPEEVVRRLAGDTTRPLLQGENVDQRVRKLMGQRGPVYEAAADIIVPVTGIEIDEIVQEISSYIEGGR